MNIVNKLNCLLFYCLFVTEIFPQGQSNILTNGNINNLFHTRSIYNISTLTPLKKNNSVGVLDSLIYVTTNNDRKRITYNYNDDLSLNYFTNAVWYSGEWIKLDKHTNTYNSEGKHISVLCESFNSTTKEWYQTEKDIFNYDSLENNIFHLHQYFNGQEFVNSFKSDYYYDVANNLVLSVNQQWMDGKWVNSFKITNTINSDNLKDTTLFQEWLNNQWINSQITIYDYDVNHSVIDILTKIWQETQWVDHAWAIFEYDDNNLVLENWQIAQNNNWKNWFRIFYEYDDDNNLIHLFGKEWKNEQWVPENEPLKVTNPDGILFGYLAKEVFLFYRNPTSVRSKKNIADGFNLFQNYPNPFNPTTTLSYQLPKASNVVLKVYDVLGKEVAELVNENKSAGIYSVNFNASNLPSGLYFYKIQTGDFTEVRKMLLMK